MSALLRLASGLLVMSLSVGHAALAAEPAPATSYSASDLYNTANAYARQGKPGLAILNYERARLLAPSDPDIEANLDFVRQTAGLPPTTQGRFRGVFRFVARIDPDLLAWLGLAGLILAGVCSLSAYHYQRHRWQLGSGVLLGVLLIGATVANAVALWPTLHSAIVLAAATPARVSPVPMGDPLFVLQEAETVRIAAAHEGFVLVESRAGQMGWVARANLAAIVPR